MRSEVPKDALERTRLADYLPRSNHRVGAAMERIFWAECCGCHGKFYGNYRELRHTGVKLMCPFCRREFLPEEPASLDDRWIDETAERAAPPAAPPD
jgi:hypothetical protein